MKVIEVVPRFKLAGAERMAESLIYGLAELGADVRAVSLYDFESSITEGLRERGIPLRSFGKRDGLDPSLVCKLYRFFSGENPDVVHTHLYAAKYAIPAAHAADVPVCLHTVHNIASEDLSGVDTVLQRWFYARGWATPVAISPTVKRTVCEKFGMSQDSVPMVLNGVSRRMPRRRGERKDGPFVFLHIGRFEPVKNHSLLLDAFERVHAAYGDCRLLMLGTGPLIEDMRHKVTELDLDDAVEIVGEVGDVAPFLAEADAFVLPSAYEGLPITLVEALQAGVPCLASNVGGVPDIVHDGENGLLFEPTVDAVAQAMNRVVSDRALLIRLASNAQGSSDSFTQERMSLGYFELMRGMVGDGHRG